MTWKMLLPCLAVAVSALAGGRSSAHEPLAEKKAKPKVEVVFCLDTTGSMSGLIDAAKQKIWAISSQIASGKPTPQLKIGLVAYRDVGDEYVTKVIELTEDLDAIHSQLMKFQAVGGGDEPESVNKALFDAVNAIKWSEDKSTLKIIFLVGDAPPHMDYANDVLYPEVCQMAMKKDIIINTIQCGDSAETEKHWRAICRKAEGSYVRIAANGGSVAVIDTPFDGALAEINAKMAKSTLVYGSATDQLAASQKAMTWCVPSSALASAPTASGTPRTGYPAVPFSSPPALGSSYSAAPSVTTAPPIIASTGSLPPAGYYPPPGYGAPPPGYASLPVPVSAPAMSAPAISSAVAADRASFCASTGCVASYDLLDSIKAGKVKLENLKKEELPKELQGLTLVEQKAYLEKLSRERAEIMKKAADLSKQRNEFIARKQAEDTTNRGGDSFDNQVLRILQRQAQRNGIDYPDAEDKKKD